MFFCFFFFPKPDFLPYPLDRMHITTSKSKPNIDTPETPFFFKKKIIAVPDIYFFFMLIAVNCNKSVHISYYVHAKTSVLSTMFLL